MGQGFAMGWGSRARNLSVVGIAALGFVLSGCASSGPQLYKARAGTEDKA